MIEHILQEIKSIKDQLDEIRARLWAPGDLTDYSDDSTITGWGVYTTKEIWYKTSGKLVYVVYRLIGTSNSVNTNFTLPFAARAAAPGYLLLYIAQDNTGALAPGILSLAAGDSTVYFNSTVAGGGWTAGGTKSVRGEFFYVAA